ncbi:3-isopropylmalate dehydratase large subunit, chloroplastic [Iris pallida]|uniref:3-isopropylmalate dehydratase large subunit, chloroplastic n=1 Tax=Iris pallida TaxID=29817 RepID=A0AAX6HYS4_IRIPA|nr:3-isopropylmalate dehydratase large subunit, chloroplastic [Iris pallida]KAJ6845863.1 3-isopropylmalate dehydratase large subunit, chloroplastic [Iris pallida]
MRFLELGQFIFMICLLHRVIPESAMFETVDSLTVFSTKEIHHKMLSCEGSGRSSTTKLYLLCVCRLISKEYIDLVRDATPPKVWETRERLFH